MSAGWSAIPGWEGFYEAHPSGLVRGLERKVAHSTWQVTIRGRVLVAQINCRTGYLVVPLYRDGKETRCPVHRLVAATFLGPRPAGLVVCHNDGVSTNNTVENLRYDTQANNLRDAVRHGTNPLASRTSCSRGHEFTPENTTRYVGRPQVRVCRECKLLYGLHYRERRRAAVAA